MRDAESNFNDMPLFGAVAYVGVPSMERLLIFKILHYSNLHNSVRIILYTYNICAVMHFVNTIKN